MFIDLKDGTSGTGHNLELTRPTIISPTCYEYIKQLSEFLKNYFLLTENTIKTELYAAHLELKTSSSVGFHTKIQIGYMFFDGELCFGLYCFGRQCNSRQIKNLQNLIHDLDLDWII